MVIKPRMRALEQASDSAPVMNGYLPARVIPVGPIPTVMRESSGSATMNGPSIQRSNYSPMPKTLSHSFKTRASINSPMDFRQLGSTPTVVRRKTSLISWVICMNGWLIPAAPSVAATMWTPGETDPDAFIEQPHTIVATGTTPQASAVASTGNP